MDTCPDFTPCQSTAGDMEPRVIRNDFGDEYTQRIGNGINYIGETWSVVWPEMEEVDALVLDAFFRAKGGHEAFYWTPKGHSIGIWTCTKWHYEPTEGDLGKVTATFKRENDLA